MMPEFDLKQIEKISEMSGLEMVKNSNGVISLLLPDITGLTFTELQVGNLGTHYGTKMGAARVIVYFNCSEWDKNLYKRKFIVGRVHNTLQRCHDNTYMTGRTARAYIYDIRAEKDPVKFCKMMLRKTINKAKLLRKNEIKNCGTKFEI